MLHSFKCSSNRGNKMTILLDWKMIFEDPSILRKNKKNISLAITEAAKTTLSMQQFDKERGEAIFALVESAEKNGIIKIYKTDIPSNHNVFGYEMTDTDISIIDCAKQLKKNMDVKIATNDKTFQQ